MLRLDVALTAQLPVREALYLRELQLALVKLVSENNSSELLERVTGTNQTKSDSDATLADAEEEKIYQK